MSSSDQLNEAKTKVIWFGAHCESAIRYSLRCCFTSATDTDWCRSRPLLLLDSEVLWSNMLLAPSTCLFHLRRVRQLTLDAVMRLVIWLQLWSSVVGWTTATQCLSVSVVNTQQSLHYSECSSTSPGPVATWLRKSGIEWWGCIGCQCATASNANLLTWCTCAYRPDQSPSHVTQWRHCDANQLRFGLVVD